MSTAFSAVVICAAGLSLRMGGVKKEYQKLAGGVTVLGAAVSAFAAVSSVKIIVIAVCENTEDEARAALPPELLSAQSPQLLFVCGGDTRRASVFNALCALVPYNPSYVLIHDGARPWVSPSLIENIITAVKKHDAVVPLLPLTDTPKECSAPFLTQGESAAVFIKNHLKREKTGAAQTPQAFKFPEILHAHEKAAQASEDFTDDAEIWGRFCGPVAAICGEQENKKITFAEDLN
ncbi:MAG: 2-C-methyl-D-erythritol 4-phosphate cytidylyltransferase [Treponema sp.]|jgi:2-C-methyl-D-erythritol 4-phosphate cytidylyltransferase/2-C-methyl-D-erythritol 4-phosphate cytidylyltransferase/2-C-methyl-D-erythritol 2,4-cyclodiphosphate synthase|nr:2-C-methyl-D-erythritol 4-phosphate cytidylyltransferase [Treponema sp.]